jgi:hypothetical protein
MAAAEEDDPGEAALKPKGRAVRKLAERRPENLP